MSSSESDPEALLSESAGQESKSSTSSLGCNFYILAFEEALVLYLIIAVFRQDLENRPNKWQVTVMPLVGLFVFHVFFQYFFSPDDPVTAGLEAIQDDMEHADFQQLFDQLHSAAPSIEHVAVGIKTGSKAIGGGHRLYNQVKHKQTESQTFAFTSWRDVSDPVSGYEDYPFAHVTITAEYECFDEPTATKASMEKQAVMAECARKAPSGTQAFHDINKVTLTPSMGVKPVEGSQDYAVTRPGESTPCWLSLKVYKIGSYLLPLFGTCYRFLYVRTVPHLHYKIVKQVSVLRQGGADWRAR
ncbi:unnamed protein product [Symbiodinium sp. CCMP2456]|nr:unnamed protein product [Symbiodinium sp. CCMP2456]